MSSVVRTHDLPVSEPWFSHIESGKKTVEGKKRSPTWEKLEKGDKLKITVTGGHDTFTALITDIKYYTSLDDYLKTETLAKTLPGISNMTDAKNVYLSEPVGWTYAEIEKYGIMALHLKKL